MYVVFCKYWGMRSEESFEFDTLSEAKDFAYHEDCMSAEIVDNYGIVVSNIYKF